MDDDPVLRAIGADLERDDPALASLLCRGPGRRRSRARLFVPLLVLTLLVPALLLPGRVLLGLLAVLLILSSPVLVAWLCASSTAPPDAPA